jgi:hypothetical protein
MNATLMPEALHSARTVFYQWLMQMSGEGIPYRKIQDAANTTLQQFSPETVGDRHSHGWHHLFSPLLRLGVAVFKGNGRYGLSPTCYLPMSNPDQSLVINGDAVLQDGFEVIYPGLAVTSVDQLGNLIRPSTLSPLTWLSRLPLPEDFIRKNFTQESSVPKRHWQQKSGYRWIDQKLQLQRPTTIYRESDEIPPIRYIGISHQIYRIPPWVSMPAAYQWASLEAYRVNPDETKLYDYNRLSSQLTIRGNFFPTEIETLLIVARILSGEPTEVFEFERVYHLTKAENREIHRLLAHP